VIMIRQRNDGKQRWEKAQLAGYSSEQELQDMLSEDPDLIPFGDLEEPGGEYRIAVKELPLPSGQFIDLLILDENGNITIVETKLARSPEARRKVLAQILDYASQLWEMSYDELDGLVSMKGQGNLVDRLRKDMGNQEWDEVAFQEAVGSKLESGVFTLLIAVDSVSEDLRRIVRYLNRSGQIKVYPLEIRYYKGGGFEAIGPRIVEVGTVTPPTPELPWDWERFAARAENEDIDVLRALHDFAQENGSLRWGRGKKMPTFSFVARLGEKEPALFIVEATGAVGVMIRQFRDDLGDDSLGAIIKKFQVIDSLSGIGLDTSWKYLKAGELKEPAKMDALKRGILEMKHLLEGSGA